jgi:flagellar biosynthesis/type III secretory pathway protein FliH
MNVDLANRKFLTILSNDDLTLLNNLDSLILSKNEEAQAIINVAIESAEEIKSQAKEEGMKLALEKMATLSAELDRNVRAYISKFDDLLVNILVRLGESFLLENKAEITINLLNRELRKLDNATHIKVQANQSTLSYLEGNMFANENVSLVEDNELTNDFIIIKTVSCYRVIDISKSLDELVTLIHTIKG